MNGIPHAHADEQDGDEAGGSEDGEFDFVDGWRVEFDAYVVSLGDFEIASTDEGIGALSDVLHVVDLRYAEPALAEIGPLPARRWDRVSFRVRAPEEIDEVSVADGVDEAQVTALRAGPYNYWVAGQAHHDASGREVHFAWGLDNPSSNRNCTNGLDDTAGVVVRNNSTVEAEITLHLEHMFWDTLGSEQTRLRFEPIAAMANDEGEVTWEALANQELANLRAADGMPLVDGDGMRVVYNPGSEPIGTLQEFILSATKTQAHLNGAGLCTIESG